MTRPQPKLDWRAIKDLMADDEPAAKPRALEEPGPSLPTEAWTTWKETPAPVAAAAPEPERQAEPAPPPEPDSNGGGPRSANPPLRRRRARSDAGERLPLPCDFRGLDELLAMSRRPRKPSPSTAASSSSPATSPPSSSSAAPRSS